MSYDMEFNLNDHVLVQLTDAGRTYHKQWWEVCTMGLTGYRPPTEDSEGWSEWQLWDLMATFGSELRNGPDNPLYTVIRFASKELHCVEGIDCGRGEWSQ